ncbi:chorismate mutase [Methanococcus aeolicus]|jgi:chorismate mutase|uniref:Chorismate mutase n=1 Tax=Methanococcus aeolicus (strain ATCC BAA-1280 / DSM 17508 / OCM 812 / Nankai-3) TaxID=419665 RepID=A6UVG9_META3|nr:chorismate mutase [Methanococcus aeolicus]ABR56491.1 Chorismate mutase [Methanococcus aeolicus Nankai-3]UXM84494.1 chorismate mutase [Methanococcus aeolicus]
MTNPKDRLNIIRNRINEIDEQLIKLMAERTQFAGEIANLKSELNMPINDEEREHHIKETIKSLCNKYDFDSNLSLEILTLLMEHSKELQKKACEKKNI